MLKGAYAGGARGGTGMLPAERSAEIGVKRPNPAGALGGLSPAVATEMGTAGAAWCSTTTAGGGAMTLGSGSAGTENAARLGVEAPSLITLLLLLLDDFLSFSVDEVGAPTAEAAFLDDEERSLAAAVGGGVAR